MGVKSKKDILYTILYKEPEGAFYISSFVNAYTVYYSQLL